MYSEMHLNDMFIVFWKLCTPHILNQFIPLSTNRMPSQCTVRDITVTSQPHMSAWQCHPPTPRYISSYSTPVTFTQFSEPTLQVIPVRYVQNVYICCCTVTYCTSDVLKRFNITHSNMYHTIRADIPLNLGSVHPNTYCCCRCNANRVTVWPVVWCVVWCVVFFMMWCVVWCGVVCCVLWCGVWCVVLYGVVWCVMWCCVVWCVWCVVWCGVFCAVVCCVVWYVVWCVVLYDVVCGVVCFMMWCCVVWCVWCVVWCGVFCAVVCCVVWYGVWCVVLYDVVCGVWLWCVVWCGV